MNWDNEKRTQQNDPAIPDIENRSDSMCQMNSDIERESSLMTQRIPDIESNVQHRLGTLKGFGMFIAKGMLVY
jgi:hypothetical protein